MTSYLENQLELLNANQKKLEDKKRILEEQIRLDIEMKHNLEMDGTIIKFETQINELKKCIDKNIMPNNIEIVVNQYNKDYSEGCNKLIENTTLNERKLKKAKLNKKIKIEKEIFKTLKV